MNERRLLLVFNDFIVERVERVERVEKVERVERLKGLKGLLYSFVLRDMNR